MPDVRHHTVQVPATSANLGPGFDAFGVALTLHLAVRTRARDELPTRVVARGEGAEDVITGDDNLVWQAFVRFCDHVEVAVPDVALEAVNRIPLERGLGSSSAAIVAGLALARAVTATPVGDPTLVELATAIEGHPDNVAPAVLGGFVVSGRDDAGALVLRRINPVARLRPVVLVPETRQATSEARAVLPESLASALVADQAARAGHVVGALTGVWPADPRIVGDHLHEPARTAVMGPSMALVTALRAAQQHAWLSGAGPSVAVALARGSRGEASLARCEELASERNYAVLPLEFDLSGALVCPDDGCGLAGSGGCAQCPRERL